MMSSHTDPSPTVTSVDWAAVMSPKLLSWLSSDQKFDHDEAFFQIHGIAWHHYPTSVTIVPFLTALAANTSVPDRHQIVNLVCDTALGSFDSSYLPNGVRIAQMRRDHERLRALTIDDEKRKFTEWVESAPDEDTKRKRDRERESYRFGLEKMELENRMAAYDAVLEKAVPTLCDLLQLDSDSEVRAAAARTLGFFPESSRKSLPLLRSIVFQESHEGEDGVPDGLLATAIVAFALLLANLLETSAEASDGEQTFEISEVEERLRHFLTHESRSLRWAAATALSCLSVVDLQIITELASAIIHPPAQTTPQIYFYLGELAGFADDSLNAALHSWPLPEETYQSAIRLLLDVLSSPNCCNYVSILAVCCKILWKIPEDSPFSQDSQVGFAGLGSEEKQFLRTLAEKPSYPWDELDNYRAVMKTWGLPAEKDACRRYVGLPELGPYKTVILPTGERFPGP